MLKERLADSGKFTYAAVLIVALGIFHSVPMIASSSSRETAIKRLDHLPLSDGRSEKIIGLRYLEDRQFEKASEWLKLSSKENPGDDSVWFNLGIINTHEDKNSEAISDFLKAVRLNPNNIKFKEHLAEAYIENHWMEEAVEEYRKLIAIDSTNVNYWIRLGYTQNHGNMFDDAIESYERVLDFAPDNDQYLKNLTSAVLNKAAALQQDNKFAEARVYYHRAKKLYPTDWIALNNLAMIEIEEENFTAAHEILSEALEMHKYLPTLHYNMALVEEKLGNYANALEHLQRSSELNRNSPPPNDDITRISKKLQEEEEKAE